MRNIAGLARCLFSGSNRSVKCSIIVVTENPPAIRNTPASPARPPHPASRLLYIPGISRNYLTMVMHHLLPGSLFHLYLERHIHNPPYSPLLTLPAIKVEIHLPKGYVRDNFQAHNQAMSSKKT